MARSSPQNELDRLVTEHLSSALRFATRMTGNVDAAEELVQESLVRVARSWKTFRHEAEFRTWLFRIIVNVFRDRLAAARPVRGTLPPEIVDDRGSDPAAEVQHLELGELIAARVSGLPPRQREVLVLTAYERLPAREIAAVLGITESNVHATLAVARERLRRDLAPYFAER